MKLPYIVNISCGFPQCKNCFIGTGCMQIIHCLYRYDQVAHFPQVFKIDTSGELFFLIMSTIARWYLSWSSKMVNLPIQNTFIKPTAFCRPRCIMELHHGKKKLPSSKSGFKWSFSNKMNLALCHTINFNQLSWAITC